MKVGLWPWGCRMCCVNSMLIQGDCGSERYLSCLKEHAIGPYGVHVYSHGLRPVVVCMFVVTVWFAAVATGTSSAYVTDFLLCAHTPQIVLREHVVSFLILRGLIAVERCVHRVGVCWLRGFGPS